MWNYSSLGDGGLNKCVELFISTNGELQVARCDTLEF